MTGLRSAVFAGPKRIDMVITDPPAPGPQEALIRLEGCGVCASNLPVWEGRPWFDYPLEQGAPGHEGWGRIAAIGSEVTSFTVGERVAALSFHAYADYDTAPVDHLVRLPEALSGMPFPGEPLGCAINIFERAAIELGQTVAIVGAGFLGLLLIQLAKAQDARVIALSRRHSALEWAQAFGASHVVRIEDESWKAVHAVKQLTDGRGCERVIEVVGNQVALDLASEITAERARLVIAGYHQDGRREVNLQQWNWQGLDVINAHERDPRRYVTGMQQAVDAVAGGKLEVMPLLTHHYPLEALGEAFAGLQARPEGFLKAWITL